MPHLLVQPVDEAATLETVARARAAYLRGGLVVFPTETVYGVSASAAVDAGYHALREFKGRPDAQPFAVHLPDAASAHRYADLSAPAISRLLRKVFPGPVTLVVDVDDRTIAQKLAELGLPQSHAPRLYHQNTIGLRCPDHPLGQAVLGSVDHPIVASSANLRGQAPPRDVHEAQQGVGDAAALVVDGGPCRHAKPSTVIRITLEKGVPVVAVQREGVYDERYIRKLMRWTMLLVCSGNTCRSPMAEGLALRMIAAKRGLAEDELELAGVRVTSAGVFAASGNAASEEGVAALKHEGIDISRHRSRRLSVDMIHEADVVYCMTRTHRGAVIQMAPWAEGKVKLLDPAGHDVQDPIGSGVSVYAQTAQEIRQHLETRMKEEHP